MWKTASVFRVDVARDVAHGGGDIGSDLSSSSTLRMELSSGRVVAAAELLADLLEGEIREIAHEVHGDLAGHGGLFAAALPGAGPLR